MYFLGCRSRYLWYDMVLILRVSLHTSQNGCFHDSDDHFVKNPINPMNPMSPMNPMNPMNPINPNMNPMLNQIKVLQSYVVHFKTK